MAIWKNSLKNYKLYKVQNGTYYFAYNYENMRIYEIDLQSETINSNVDGKNYLLSEENLQYVKSQIKTFYEKVAKAISKDGGYNKAEFKAGYLYYKNTGKANYSFMCITKDCVYFNYELPFKYFLENFDVDTFDFGNAGTYRNYLLEKWKQFLPLLNSAKEANDEYLVSRLNYNANNFTKKDVDIINEFEGNDILFIDKEIYDVNDIAKIKEIKLGARSMFSTRTWYIFKIEIDGKDYTAIYYPEQPNKIRVNNHKVYIKITNELVNKVRILLGETEENSKTRKLMQLGNYHYYHKKHWTAQQKSKIFSDLSKVSLNELKSLPKHWLDRIPDCEFYDWLQCTGLVENKEANCFVESIVKARQNSKDKK